MSSVNSRRALALAFVLLAACGGKSSVLPPPPPKTLELACSVATSGPNQILTVVGRATSKATTGPDITVTLGLSPTPVTFALKAPGWIGSAEFRGTGILAGSSVSGQATVDGVAETASCPAVLGLAQLTAHGDRTATGADLGWSSVAGAAVYRWSIREGVNGALIDSGTGTGLAATSAVVLDPLKHYVVEVGGYALTGTETSYPTPLPAPKASFGRALFTAGSTGGDGVTAWQLFSPGDYVNGTLTVGFPALQAGERLAVLLLNSDGADASSATVTTTGTAAPDMAAVSPWSPQAAMASGGGAGVDETFSRDGAMAGEALVSAWRQETSARLRDGRLPRIAPAPLARGVLAAAAPLTDRSFCQARLTQAGTFASKMEPATFAYQTPEGHAAFYYTNEVAAGVAAALAARPDFFSALGAAYEANIRPALNTYFGQESDVDGNGLVIFLFGNLGKSSGSFVAGYFWQGDIELPLATSTTCPRSTGGNRADMLYLLDPGNYAANRDPSGTNYAATLDSLISGEYTSTMSHELQHDVNYNTRCPPGEACGPDEELWLNEGLSMLSETVAGYGLHDASSRSSVRRYQGEAAAPASEPYYQAFGLTVWEGNPIGNYAGVQSYMQYLLDHATPAMTRALENKWLYGKANVESATGVPWELGFARFATASMFSNEDAAEPNGGAGNVTSAGNLLATPELNFLGVNYPNAPPAGDYVPWHHYTGFCTVGGVRYDKARLAHVAYKPLAASSLVPLRRDGWAALATGPGTGAAATITVKSDYPRPPHVVVVKYTGTLPNYTPISTTCP